MASTSPARGSIDSLTSLRGLAAAWVVIYHFSWDLIALFPDLEGLRVILFRGTYAVPLFFILSGFVLAYNYADRFRSGPLTWSSYRTFVELRLARIYPVHLATLLIVLVMAAVARKPGLFGRTGGYSWPTFVQNVFLVHSWTPRSQLSWNYPSWSISSEWFAYLWFPPLAAVVLARLTSAARALALLAIAWVVAFRLYTDWRPPFLDLLMVVPTFVAGTALHALWRHVASGRIARSRLLRVVPELAVAGILAVSYVPEERVVVASYLLGFVVLILALALLGPACSGLWTHRLTLALGEASYSLYMTHTLVQKVCYTLLPVGPYREASPGSRLVVVGVYGLLVAVACAASYRLVEKPARQYFRARLSRPRGQ